MDVAFDVVIPTTRLAPEQLLPLLRVHESVPREKVSYYLVVDQPDADLRALEALVQDRADATLLQNATWLGAHGTRNRGIEAGGAELIVFLDDDVVPAPGLLAAYVAAIAAAPTSPGYVGVTRFPAPRNRFTAGIVASDILTFFGLAETRPRMPWGVTANLCLRRSALGDLRFSGAFPNAGGGEDIDLCLRIAQSDGGAFVSVPEACVDHPWWGGRRGSYQRFFRWAFGDSQLPALHPQHRYWNAPTLPEALLLLALAWVLRPRRWAVGMAIVPALVGVEVLVDYGKLWGRGRRAPFAVALESTIIRLANDAGRLVGNVSRGRPWGLCERFDYFCDRVHVAGERRVAAAKLVGWMVVVALIVRRAR